MRMSRSAPIIMSAALAIGLVGMVAPSQASTKATATANGTCSKGSLSNLQVQREDNGTLSIDFGVDMATHASGVNWVVKVTDNKSIVYRGHALTAADGSVSVTKVIAPMIGANHVSAIARNSTTGEICKLRTVI